MFFSIICYYFSSLYRFDGYIYTLASEQETWVELLAGTFGFFKLGLKFKYRFPYGSCYTAKNGRPKEGVMQAAGRETVSLKMIKRCADLT